MPVRRLMYKLHESDQREASATARRALWCEPRMRSIRPALEGLLTKAKKFGFLDFLKAKKFGFLD